MLTYILGLAAVRIITRVIFFVIKSIISLIFWILLISIVLVVSYILLLRLGTPSHSRDWSNDQSVLPSADIVYDADQLPQSVAFYNIRNNRYTSTTEYTVGHYNKTYDLSQLRGVYYIVEPFQGYDGSAHSFLSFQFEGNPEGFDASMVNDDFVAVSVEIRKEEGESFSAVKGLLNQYEIMYVVADERDVIDLRANHRNDDVYVYPLLITPDAAQQLFLSATKRVQGIYEQPEYYNTISNNCTTNIAHLAREIAPDLLPRWDMSYLLPAYSDELLYEAKLIRLPVEGMSYHDMREYYKVNTKAAPFKYASDEDRKYFSAAIRVGDPVAER